MTNQQFSLAQIEHCLAIIDQPSGLNRRQFAITQDLTYGQIRSWQSQAPRWRAKLIDAAPIAPTVPPAAPPTSCPPFASTCSQGPRSVVLHCKGAYWP